MRKLTAVIVATVAETTGSQVIPHQSTTLFLDHEQTSHWGFTSKREFRYSTSYRVYRPHTPCSKKLGTLCIFWI